jgi:nitrogen fixation/metabolism regulation signal transduction histidine kinase
MQLFFLRFVILYLIIVCAFFGYIAVRVNSYSTDFVASTITSVSVLQNVSTDSELAHNLRHILAARDNEFLIYITLSIVVVILGASFLTIIFSNRVAGPAFRIRYALKQFKAGDYAVRVQLRKDDQLKGLAEDLNEFVTKLEDERKQS